MASLFLLEYAKEGTKDQGEEVSLIWSQTSEEREKGKLLLSSSIYFLEAAYWVESWPPFIILRLFGTLRNWVDGNGNKTQDEVGGFIFVTSTVKLPNREQPSSPDTIVTFRG